MITIVMPTWLAWVLGLLVPLFVLAAKTWIKSRVEAGVKAAFDRELELHKHELQRLSDVSRDHLQRQLHDFTLFTAKRHETYAELYKLLRVAEGKVCDIVRAGMSGPDFRDLDTTDLEEYLRERKFTGKKLKEVVEAFGRDRDEALKLYDAHERTIAIFEAKDALADAQNFCVTGALYLSQEVYAKVQKSLSVLKVLYHTVESEMERHPREYLDDEHAITVALNDVRFRMQGEVLGGGPEAESLLRMAKPVALPPRER